MRKIKMLTTILCSIILPIKSAFAVCPLCTVAVGAGVGLSRWMGIDDTVTGLWIGGLLVSLVFWTVDWFDREKIRFFGRNTIVTAGYYLITIVPLDSMHIIGHPLNILWGFDKLIFGIIVGSIVFLIGAKIHFHLKRANNNKVYFPFQKVVMPIAPLLALSIVFYLMMR